jgi:hypothetical protein
MDGVVTQKKNLNLDVRNIRAWWGCFLGVSALQNVFGNFSQVLVYEIQAKFRLKFLLVHYEIQG